MCVQSEICDSAVTGAPHFAPVHTCASWYITCAVHTDGAGRFKACIPRTELAELTEPQGHQANRQSSWGSWGTQLGEAKDDDNLWLAEETCWVSSPSSVYLFAFLFVLHQNSVYLQIFLGKMIILLLHTSILDLEAQFAHVYILLGCSTNSLACNLQTSFRSL